MSRHHPRWDMGPRAPSELAVREAMAVLEKAAPDTLCVGILGDGVTPCVPGHRFWQRAGRRWGLWLGEHFVASGEETQGIWQMSLMSVVSGGLSKPVNSPWCGQGRSAVGSSPALPATGREREVTYGIGQCHVKYFHHRESPAPKVALNIWKFC